MLYWIGYVLFVILSKFLFPIKVYGIENIPVKGGFILASNHLSNLDPFVVGISIKRRLCFIAKDSLFRNKILGFILSEWGAFPLKRESRDIGAVKEALKRLKRGYGLVIFPEGTRIKKDMNKFLPGVALLSDKGQVPVIPTFVKGANDVLPAGARQLKRHPVTVYFGKAVEHSSHESYQETTSRIMQEIRALSPQH